MVATVVDDVAKEEVKAGDGPRDAMTLKEIDALGADADKPAAGGKTEKEAEMEEKCNE